MDTKTKGDICRTLTLDEIDDINLKLGTARGLIDILTVIEDFSGVNNSSIHSVLSEARERLDEASELLNLNDQNKKGE